MKIAVIGHIRHPIAAPFMGGMEVHCHKLVSALRTRGHDVALLAARGSDGTDLIDLGAPYEDVLPWDEWHGTRKLAQYQREAFERGWEHVMTGGVDVVHNNSLCSDLIEWAARDCMPMLTSQHVPPFGAMHDAVIAARDCRWLHFSVTSQNQLGLWDRRARSRMHVVYNGIDPEDWPVMRERSERLLWFGRITPNKGLREAVEAARQAGAGLDIVGSIEDRDYFELWAEPHLGETIRYLGHLSGDALKRSVASARAVLVTPVWDEPFGLVAAEAMACGVPVIAFDRGAMREVLGRCGKLVPAGDVQALADAIRCASELDGSLCREEVARRFSIDAMLDGYERCYALAMVAAEASRTGGHAPASSSARTEALLA